MESFSLITRARQRPPSLLTKHSQHQSPARQKFWIQNGDQRRRWWRWWSRRTEGWRHETEWIWGDDKKKRKEVHTGRDRKGRTAVRRRGDQRGVITGRTAFFFFSWVTGCVGRAGPPQIHPGLISQLRLQLIIKHEHLISTADLPPRYGRRSRAHIWSVAACRCYRILDRCLNYTNWIHPKPGMLKGFSCRQNMDSIVRICFSNLMERSMPTHQDSVSCRRW